MDDLKILFIGIGSIARRHIRNLCKISEKKSVAFTIDAYRRSAAKDTPKEIDTVYGNIEDVPDDYDAVFITNPTNQHLQTLKKFHDKGRHFFIEKPVVSIDQLEEAKAFTLRDDSIYYVASPLRYNAVIQYIKDQVDPDKVISIRSISSSYLPDWRPGKDYRDTYSACRDMGGGVGIDLIHEWDYLTFLFGWPDKVLHMAGKKSQLEIDSDDYAIYIAEYDNHITELHLDYFGRSTIREIELFTTEDTIVGDITHNKIRHLKREETIIFKEDRDTYQIRELEHFLEMMKGNETNEDGYNHGLRVLELTQGIA